MKVIVHSHIETTMNDHLCYCLVLSKSQVETLEAFLLDEVSSIKETLLHFITWDNNFPFIPSGPLLTYTWFILIQITTQLS